MVLICYFIKILLYEEEVYEHRMKHRQILELESWARLEPPGGSSRRGGGVSWAYRNIDAIQATRNGREPN